MAVPVMSVDMAFGSSPGAASFTWTNVHTDGSAKTPVRDLGYSRGRLNELNQIQAGSGSLLLGDKASDFDPDNAAGLYSANVRPYVPVRAQATIGGVTYPLFQHFVQSWPRTMRVASTWTERSVTTIDGFEWMANAGLAGATYAQELSGTRVTNVLNTIGWSSALRTIGAGVALEQALTLSATDTTKALTHLLAVSQDENGLFFIDSGGKVVFVQRSALITGATYTTSQATFHDAVAGGAGFSFVDTRPAYDLQTTFNQFTVTRSSGVAQTASDAASQGLYGLRTQQLSSFVTSDSDALAQAQWKLGLFKSPLNRLDTLTVMPGTDTAFWQAVLPLEVGMRITVREQAPGFAVVKQADYLIQKIDAHFPAGTPAQATFTFGLWPATTASWFILDNASLGKLDSGLLAY